MAERVARVGSLRRETRRSDRASAAPRTCRRAMPASRRSSTGACDRRAAEALGEPVVAFKDKLNYKQPGGAGYSTHQDLAAYPGVERVVSILVAIDDCRVESGCLWLAHGVREVLPVDERGVVRSDVAATLDWFPAELSAGDAVCIDGLAPHYSEANDTDASAAGAHRELRARARTVRPGALLPRAGRADAPRHRARRPLPHQHARRLRRNRSRARDHHRSLLPPDRTPHSCRLKRPSLARIALGFALAFVIGFERELRGSPAGDRTFSLVGGAATAITATVWKTSPQALAGVVTGIGFIGAGVVVHGQNEFVRGITTASAIFATAGIGVVVGTGHLALGAITTALRAPRARDSQHAAAPPARRAPLPGLVPQRQRPAEAFRAVARRFRARRPGPRNAKTTHAARPDTVLASEGSVLLTREATSDEADRGRHLRGSVGPCRHLCRRRRIFVRAEQCPAAARGRADTRRQDAQARAPRATRSSSALAVRDGRRCRRLCVRSPRARQRNARDRRADPRDVAAALAAPRRDHQPAPRRSRGMDRRGGARVRRLALPLRRRAYAGRGARDDIARGSPPLRRSSVSCSCALRPRARCRAPSAPRSSGSRPARCSARARCSRKHSFTISAAASSTGFRTGSRTRWPSAPSPASSSRRARSKPAALAAAVGAEQVMQPLTGVALGVGLLDERARRLGLRGRDHPRRRAGRDALGRAHAGAGRAHRRAGPPPALADG